jgi:hypothetical protein
MEDDSSLIEGLKNDPLSIIDEKPELTTLVLATKLQKEDKSSLSDKILSKISKGYTCFTVSKILAYSLAETVFILPYCLKKVGIVPYFVGLIIICFISFYIFYIFLDVIIKLNLFKNYHQILRQNLGKKFRLIYYILNLLYHTLLLILETYIFLHFTLKLLSLFDLDIKGKFIYILIILLSLVIIQFPLSYINFLKTPDIFYITFIGLFNLINLISLVFFISYKFKNDIITGEGEKNQITSITFIEGISFDYIICFSVFIIIIGWQNQISRHLGEFKIKTTRRFFNILYLTFIVQIILCLINGLVNTPLMIDNENNNDFKIKLFVLYYNEEIIPTLMIKIILIIFCIFFNILMPYRLSLLEENFDLFLEETIYKPFSIKKRGNKILISLFKLVILFLSAFINLIINDISYIILLLGGILASVLNFLNPTLIYWKLVSKNNLVIRIALILSIIVIIINLVGLILKIIFQFV